MSLDLSATATDLLKRLGSSDYVTLKSTTGQTLDPVLGAFTGGTATETKLNAAVLSVTENLLQDERIQADDKRVIFDNKVTPKMDDLLSWAGDDYKIISIDGYNHAGTQQYWDLVCRK